MYKSILLPLRLVVLMWLAFFAELATGMQLVGYGIVPRTEHGLIGIVTAPLLHGNLSHLISNAVPLLLLGATIGLFYHKLAAKVFFTSYFITGLLVWCIGRPYIHIGASGLIYGLAGFLMFFGLLKKDFKSLFISILIMLLYGSLIYGVFPSGPEISFESHLMGFITGIGTAYGLRKGSVR